MAILKSDFSVSLCQFSKKRPKKKIDKELDNFQLRREGVRELYLLYIYMASLYFIFCLMLQLKGGWNIFLFLNPIPWFYFSSLFDNW